MLQAWTDGKESGVLIHVGTVMAHCSGVTATDFGSYMSRWYDEDAILRGFYLYETRRKVHSVYIFDRFKAQ